MFASCILILWVLWLRNEANIETVVPCLQGLVLFLHSVLASGGSLASLAPVVQGSMPEPQPVINEPKPEIKVRNTMVIYHKICHDVF